MPLITPRQLAMSTTTPRAVSHAISRAVSPAISRAMFPAPPGDISHVIPQATSLPHPEASPPTSPGAATAMIPQAAPHAAPRTEAPMVPKAFSPTTTRIHTIVLGLLQDIPKEEEWSQPKGQMRPNTKIHYELFTPHPLPMPIVPLKAHRWKSLCAEYPDRAVADAVVGIAQFGARIGFIGESRGQRIASNLLTAGQLPDILRKDLQEQMESDRLMIYEKMGDLPHVFYSSPLGLVDKPNGKKRRIHHLSHPPGQSVNDGIPLEFGEITYSTVNDVIAIVQRLGQGTVMIKRDFADAFRQIPVSPLDTPLLGFSFEHHFYAERFQPFGLRTAPYLFNLFAKLFHWILEQQLQAINNKAQVIHYLDDFIVLLPPGSDWRPISLRFQQLAHEVGLKIKNQKNEEGTLVNFGGVIFDTREMAIRLPAEKREKGLAIISKHQGAASISLHDLQQLTGFLNFVTLVVPLGRAFIRRLYNLQLYFPQNPHARRRISAEERKDLVWWGNLLLPLSAIERRFLPIVRQGFSMWTDASGLKGLGGYYQAEPYHSLLHIRPVEAFMLALPRHIQHREEHINAKEMRAVEEGFLRWGQHWRGCRVTLYIDNQAVVYAIKNRTIRGSTMDILRRCLLLASQNDLELRPCWIPTGMNKLADALSRFDRGIITNLSPQLLPLFDHQSHGSPTCEARD